MFILMIMLGEICDYRCFRHHLMNVKDLKLNHSSVDIFLSAPKKSKHEPEKIFIAFTANLITKVAPNKIDSPIEF